MSPCGCAASPVENRFRSSTARTWCPAGRHNTTTIADNTKTIDQVLEHHSHQNLGFFPGSKGLDKAKTTAERFLVKWLAKHQLDVDRCECAEIVKPGLRKTKNRAKSQSL